MTSLIQTLTKPLLSRLPAGLAARSAAVDGQSLFFDPSDIRFVRDTNDAIIAADTDVKTLLDKSGNLNKAVNATADKMPLYKLNAINGKPGIQFGDDNTVKNLTVANSPTLKSSQFYCLFVWRPGELFAANNRLIGKWDITNSMREWSAVIQTDGKFHGLLSLDGGAPIAANNILVDLAIQIDTNYAFEIGYNGTIFYIAVNNGTRATNATTTPFQSTSGIFIGSNEAAGGYTERSEGTFGKIHLFNRTPTPAEKAQLYKEIKDEYGIAV